MLAAIWQYRGFISGSVQREFQTRYRNSLLGALWTVLNPLAMILVYTLVFSSVMGNRLPGHGSGYAYSIYLCAGIFTWALFAEITTRASTVFIDHANLIKKLSFPRICLPVVVVLNALVNFAVIFGLFLLFLALTGTLPGWPLAALLPLLLAEVVFAIGLGMVLGVLNVFFRDVGQAFGIVLQFWFWFTPVVYVATVLPPEVRGLLAWNPLYGVIGGFQRVLVDGLWPDWAALAPACVIGALLCAAGMRLFRARVGEMVDEL